jgi:hypothetical protein
MSGRLTSFDHDLDILKQHTIEKQEPFATVLSCADSRVPVELIFDQSIGHIFVVRVAGNIVTAEIIASMEYGAAVLGARVVLVLGHAGCGAVKAGLSAKEVPGQISALYSRLQPAVDQAGAEGDPGILRPRQWRRYAPRVAIRGLVRAPADKFRNGKRVAGEKRGHSWNRSGRNILGGGRT